MSKKSTTTNEVAWSNPPATPQSTKLESMVGQVDYATPIRNSYARAARDLDQSYRSPLGAYTTADAEQKAKRAYKFDLKQNMGADLGNAAMQTAQNTFGQQAMVAELLQPRNYTSQSQTKTSDPFGTALQIGGLGLSGVTAGLTGSRK